MPRLRLSAHSCARLALSVSLLAAAPQDQAALSPGLPVERALAAGQSHVYEIELGAGRAWRVAVEQRGIDVVLEVRAPDGRRLAAVDGPVDRQGLETLLVVPQSSGRYAVEVRAREQGAPVGRYRIGVEELAQDTAADRQRIAAETAMTRAGEHYLEGTAEARRQALADYGQAREAWRALGERREEARALYAVSVLSRLVNLTRPALAAAEEVLPLWRSLGDRLWEASTWNEIGLDHWLLGENEDGRAAFEQALTIERGIGDRYGEGVSLSNLCLMDLSQGELRKGLACYGQAIPVLREVQAQSLEGSALLSVGRVYDVLGEPEQALERYRQALDRMKATGDRLGEARTLNHLGLVYRVMGEYQEALSHLGRALEAFRSLEDRRWQATVLHNMGLIYQGLGESPRALSAYEQALRLRRDIGDAKEEAATLTVLGEVSRLLGRPREALDFDQQALALQRSMGDRWGEGVALNQLGLAALALGDSSAALAHFDRAVELLHATGSLADEADALARRGEAYVHLGDPWKGLESLRHSLELARSAGYRAFEVKVEVAMARAERQIGHAGEARAHAEAALALAETLRTRIGSPDLRASFSALTHDAYELEVELLMATSGRDREALEVTERARARTLLELLAEAGVDVHQGVEPRLLERRTSLLRRLSAKAELALRALPRTADEKAALEEDRDAILRDLDVVETEIRERSPAYAALVQPQPLSASQIQALLDADTLLLSYSLGEARSFLWAVTAASIASFELPGRAVLEAAARRFHEDLSVFAPADRPRQAQDGEALGRLLLGPVADRLARRRLVVVPDGALAYVPFGALPATLPPSAPGGAPPAPLVQTHEIVYLPSASALAVQRRVLARRPSAPERLIVLADPVFDPRDSRLAAGHAPSRRPQDRPSPSPLRGAGSGEAGPIFERLPGSRAEAAAISALAPAGGSRVVLDFDASRAEALSDRLSAYRIIHFATHGVIDTEHPALSGLALSMVDAGGKPVEGFLHLHDIYNLRLNADLVVLSGCRTALGKELQGEGLIGLTRGFQYAGARRVVASLWRVEDQATAALMVRFYRALWVDGLRPAAALREAQLWMRQQRRWRDPYFWAGFVLQGDWN